jgi:hypothetical protein
MVEMRNPQAFQIELGVQHKVFSKITFEKPAILRPEDVERECVAAFFNCVDDFLKLGKHGLPEKRAPQVVDLPIDDVGAHLRIARRFEQMIGEEFLVERRCNFRQENRVLVILKPLRILREPAVHGVTSFMCKRVDIGENVLFIIHQDVGRRLVASG